MKPKLQTTGLLLALALIFAYVETLVPVPFGIPGMKLGLPNLMTVLLLYHYGAKEALCVNLLRIVLSGFLFGGFQSILFSLSGAFFSFAGMVLLRKTELLDMAGVSLAGGVLHNLGQLLTAAFVVKTAGVLYYAPALAVSGCVTGLAIGALAKRLLPLIKKIT